MIRRPLSLHLLDVALRVHSLEPVRRALLAYALVSDEVLDRIASVPFGSEAGELRDLLLEQDVHPEGYAYRPYLTEARACGLANAARWCCSPAAIALAHDVDTVTVRQLAEMGPVDGLLRLAHPARAARRIRQRATPEKWERDLAVALRVTA